MNSLAGSGFQVISKKYFEISIDNIKSLITFTSLKDTGKSVTRPTNKMSKSTNYIRIEHAGYGHKKITIEYYGKEISCVTNNMSAVDDYNSEEGERKDGRLRTNTGYRILRSEVIRSHKQSKEWTNFF